MNANCAAAKPLFRVTIGVMNKHHRPQILLTNDDGIQSPGLWEAARALSELGYVTIAAPREQQSGTGRSLPVTSDGKITATQLSIGSQEWTAYAVGGTPGQAVLHAIYEIMPVRPDIVVSGINYGENVGTGITISGTVGAALEAASLGIFGIAISLQTSVEHQLSYSDQIDFSTSAYFTRYFTGLMLEKKANLPEDVQAIKIEIPDKATSETPWRFTRMAQHRYYFPTIQRKGKWEDPAFIDVYVKIAPEEVAPDTDVYCLLYDQMVSVTPLTLDLTSRVSLDSLKSKIE
jgi:5'-nucleotidase